VATGSYTLGSVFNDAEKPTSLTYRDGEVFSLGYSAHGWLTSAVTTPSGGSQVNLPTGMAYSGVGGAVGYPTVNIRWHSSERTPSFSRKELTGMSLRHKMGALFPWYQAPPGDLRSRRTHGGEQLERRVASGRRSQWRGYDL